MRHTSMWGLTLGTVALLAACGSTPDDAVAEEPVLSNPQAQATATPPAQATDTQSPRDPATIRESGRQLIEASWQTLTPGQQDALCREFVLSPDDSYAQRIATNPQMQEVSYDVFRAFLTRTCV
jgi:hypothetical protein